jgi:hypothetical protein
VTWRSDGRGMIASRAFMSMMLVRFISVIKLGIAKISNMSYLIKMSQSR